MKKIFLILALITFGITANAQAKKVVNAKSDSSTLTIVPAEEAKKDAKKLQELLSLDETKTQDFINLFQLKYETLAVKDLSDVRKTELNRIIDMKIRATLTPDQMQVVEANKEFYTKLVN